MVRAGQGGGRTIGLRVLFWQGRDQGACARPLGKGLSDLERIRLGRELPADPRRRTQKGAERKAVTGPQGFVTGLLRVMLRVGGRCSSMFIGVVTLLRVYTPLMKYIPQ